MMKRICVFCGSSSGTSPAYLQTATRLGEIIAARGIGLVYGGARCGLMGAVANAAIENGGEVIGVIPEALIEKEIAHVGVSDLRIVGSMHERKMLMSDLADAFIAMPGGMGTVEEFCEILTWAQLGLHKKPCGLLNVEDYYHHLISFLDHAVAERFVKPEHRSLLVIDEEPQRLIERLESYEMPAVSKWIDRQDT
ncbi:MAG TPA: TIGR00730 family Rossman fold protein [Blastocatellia bacterium]|nr:TIGR00730 family Rossman fold protein [Blastocatellia bacterium]